MIGLFALKGGALQRVNCIIDPLLDKQFSKTLQPPNSSTGLQTLVGNLILVGTAAVISNRNRSFVFLSSSQNIFTNRLLSYSFQTDINSYVVVTVILIPVIAFSNSQLTLLFDTLSYN